MLSICSKPASKPPSQNATLVETTASKQGTGLGKPHSYFANLVKPQG